MNSRMENNPMIFYNKEQFAEALQLVEDAKRKGLKNIGLFKVKVELDVLTNGLYPEITVVTDTGRHYEYIGDDFAQGLDALRKLIAKAYKGGNADGQA